MNTDTSTKNTCRALITTWTHSAGVGFISWGSVGSNIRRCRALIGANVKPSAPTSNAALMFLRPLILVRVNVCVCHRARSQRRRAPPGSPPNKRQDARCGWSVPKEVRCMSSTLLLPGQMWPKLSGVCFTSRFVYQKVEHNEILFHVPAHHSILSTWAVWVHAHRPPHKHHSTCASVCTSISN